VVRATRLSWSGSGGGGHKSEENPIEGSEDTHTMAMRGDRTLAGMMSQQPEQVEMGLPPMWNTHITSDDIDAIAPRVETAGGSVMGEPFDVTGTGRPAGRCTPRSTTATPGVRSSPPTAVPR